MKLQQIKIPDNYMFVSLDVVSLFPNIPKDLLIKIIKSEWNKISEHTDILLNLFSRMIRLNYVILSALKKFKFEIPILQIYVDDLVMAISKDKVDFVVSTFNSINRKLKFTCELETENKIPFLDKEIIRNDDGTVYTDWYRKPTSGSTKKEHY